MGRAKLEMKLIEKEKARHMTFKKRKEGLLRKMIEFTTLCDVKACIIILGPKQDGSSLSSVETWPPKPEEVRHLIELYKVKSKESGNKSFGLYDFFQDRKRKIEEEIMRVRRKNMDAKYPTKPQFLSALNEPQLRLFAMDLGRKAEYIKSRISVMKNYVQPYNVGAEMHMHYPDPEHQSSIMMLMNENNDHYGVQYNNNQRQMFYDSLPLLPLPAPVSAPAPGPLIVDPMMYQNNPPMYYLQAPPPAALQYIQEEDVQYPKQDPDDERFDHDYDGFNFM